VVKTYNFSVLKLVVLTSISPGSILFVHKMSATQNFIALSADDIEYQMAAMQHLITRVYTVSLSLLSPEYVLSKY